MPPKKLSISRIRAESRVRSDDPDLNRASSSSSSYRRSTPASSNRASQRYRSVAAASKPRGNSNSTSNGKRPKRTTQPKVSARILHIQHDDIEETRVQNLFAPDPRTQRQNVSYRPLTLTQQARRDGDAFKLPTLADMCCSVIASCFDALLPSRDQFEAAAGPSTAPTRKPIRNSHTAKSNSKSRKRSRARAFGAAPDSDDDQQDYVPSDDEPASTTRTSRSARNRTTATTSVPSSSQLLAGWTTSELHYLTRKTSEQLEMLSPATSFLLFKSLVEHAPQHLTKSVVANYFLPPIFSSSASYAARSHVWLPASTPLLSHDKSAAAFLVAHLTHALTSVRDRHLSNLLHRVVEQMPLAALPSRFAMSQSPSFALRSLQLHGLTRLTDSTLARFFEAAAGGQDALLKLETISLKGCIAVGDRTVSALCRSTGATLRYLNLDFTDVTADSVYHIMTHLPHLHTLKLGYNENLTDKSLQSALQAPKEGPIPFAGLRNLRLRQCAQVGDAGVAGFLKYCHQSLEVLDISGTGVGGSNVHSPDLSILVMSFFPLGLPPSGGENVLALRKLNLLDTNLDYSSLVKLIDRSPNIDSLLLRQMPSRTTHDGLIQLLSKVTGEWRGREWKRLHLGILDVGDEFAELFPTLLAILERLTIESLKSSQSQTSFFRSVPDMVVSEEVRVKHLKLPDAKLSDTAWQFLPKIQTLHTLNLSNTAVPEAIVAKTIASNPFLELLDLSHCKQMRISTRRNAFNLVNPHQ